ncbi:MAG: SPFH domain-containing protein, partial [Chloroflexi bacterium]|nr:SPFH domain-containing protein [Chloroflexota bacterium]
MTFWKKVRGQIIDIVEWVDETSDTLVYRFPRFDNEIKNGAMLVVREGQMAAFVNKGQLADVFAPGLYELFTDNLPILSTLMGWKYGFASPFKAEVYFFSTRNFTDLKWGTKNPLMMRDQEFGFVRLRAFGTYSIRIKDPGRFLREIVGTDDKFTTSQISEQLRNIIVSRFADALGETQIPAVDLVANYDELAEFISARVRPDFEAHGLELSKLLVENVSLPPEVEKALDKRTSMDIVGNLGAYSQFQAANALEDAASNPGPPGGAMGMGMGMIMSNQMAQNVAQNTAQQPAP